MPGRRLALLFLLVGLALSPGPSRVAAQDPTPPAEGEAPGPAECTVAPVTVDELVALWVAAIGTPPAAVSPVDAAQLVPAESETAEAAAATVRQIVACINAGDAGRILALFSDEFVRSLRPEDDESPEDIRAEVESNLLATPEPVAADEQIRLISVDVSQTPDGRVVAAVVVEPADTLGEGYWSFVEEDGRWLMDGVLAVAGPEDVGPAATASPGQGTLADPVPLGAAAPVGDWSVWVAAVDADAAAALTAHAATNPTPGDGQRFVLITLGTGYLGPFESDPFLDLTWSAVGQSGQTYVEDVDECEAELPDDLIRVDEIVSGGIGVGTICFAVLSEDAEDLVLGLEPLDGASGGPVYFALR